MQWFTTNSKDSSSKCLVVILNSATCFSLLKFDKFEWPKNSHLRQLNSTVFYAKPVAQAQGPFKRSPARKWESSIKLCGSIFQCETPNKSASAQLSEDYFDFSWNQVKITLVFLMKRHLSKSLTWIGVEDDDGEIFFCVSRLLTVTKEVVRGKIWSSVEDCCCFLIDAVAFWSCCVVYVLILNSTGSSSRFQKI